MRRCTGGATGPVIMTTQVTPERSNGVRVSSLQRRQLNDPLLRGGLNDDFVGVMPTLALWRLRNYKICSNGDRHRAFGERIA